MVILASTSPRRKQLLSAMGVQFDVVPSNFKEYFDESRSPEAVAEELGLGKAMSVARQYPESVVVGSDVFVSYGNRQLGKPATMDEARAMFQLLAGQRHKISTSVAVVCMSEGVRITKVAESWVVLKPYDPAIYEPYIRTGDGLDKAGGYGVQNPDATPLIDHIEGDFDTIVGLPTRVLAPILNSIGIPATPARPVIPKGLVIKQPQVR